MTDSKSAPGSDLEILLSDHRMTASSDRNYTDHHIVAKVYSQKGVERTSIFSVEYEKSRKVFNIRARVVKPSGSSVELTKEDLHQTTVAKTGGYQILRTTFAFPNVQPGDVLDYRWTEEIGDTTGYLIEFCQALEVPTREYVFEIESSTQDFALNWYNCSNVEFKNGSRRVVIRNLPPFISEPMIPAETEFRGWLMLQFTSSELRLYSNDDAWNSIGDYLGEDFRLGTVPNAAIKAKVAQLTAKATTPEEKLAELYHFSQTSTKNLDFFGDAALADAKKRRNAEESEQTAAKTLERGTGKSIDIDFLFAGLARAAGFETRLALSPDRTRVLKLTGNKGWMFADRRSVAVKIGDNWKFYTPGENLVPAGLLGTQDEGSAVFVCDEKKSWFGTMQVGLPNQSQSKRTGKFTVDAEGTLEGDVEFQITGHRAIALRDDWWNFSEEDTTKSVRDLLIQRLPTAEIEQVKTENVREPTQPFILRYHVRVPGYAEALGSRLALPLNFFEANIPELFTNETRRYPIFFEFAEEKHDDIEITIPAGFTLDGASAPAPVGQAADVINARYTVAYHPKTKTIVYHRDQVTGNGGAIAFRAESYPGLRSLFSKIHRSDVHQLVLKPKPASAPASGTGPSNPPSPTAASPTQT